MCAEALADIVVFNQTFLQAKKRKKKEEPQLRGLRVEALGWLLFLFIKLFRVQKIQKKKNLNYAVCVSRLSTGRGDRTRTCGILVPNEPMKAISAKNSFFRPFPLGKPRSSPLPSPLFPSGPKR